MCTAVLHPVCCCALLSFGVLLNSNSQGSRISHSEQDMDRFFNQGLSELKGKYKVLINI